MIWLLLAVVVLALVFGPAAWVRSVMERYRDPPERYPGTGAELVRYLATGIGLEGLTVERTSQGDHYDPATRTIRLTPANHDGRSLTAVTVAAHELGHALQHYQGFGPLAWRTRLARLAVAGQKAGVVVLMAAPLIGVVTRAPLPGGVLLLAGLAGLGLAAVLHAVTLPVELDASFRRALPLMERAGLLRPEDLPRARRLLTAAALTYVAAALRSLLDVGRWLVILRR